jgi:hypothetical protein
MFFATKSRVNLWRRNGQDTMAYSTHELTHCKAHCGVSETGYQAPPTAARHSQVLVFDGAHDVVDDEQQRRGRGDQRVPDIQRPEGSAPCVASAGPGPRASFIHASFRTFFPTGGCVIMLHIFSLPLI